MKMKIAKSQVDTFPDFAGMAAAHAVDMRTWRAHMARVKEDEVEGVTGINRHTPYQRPAAHPLIESVINENDEADFEVVDDGPTPEEILQLRKIQLLGEVTRAEQAAIAVVFPPAKQRLLLMKEQDVRRRDSEIVADLREQERVLLEKMVNKIAVTVGLKKPLAGKEIAAAVNAQRSDDEQELLADLKSRRKRLAAIERVAAQAHADIEDLTADTIDAWQVPDFSKI